MKNKYLPKEVDDKASFISSLAQKGDLQALKEALESNPELGVDIRDSWNYTPLMWAARSGHREIVEYLLNKGADVNAQDGLGQDPLTLAMPARDDIAKVLLARPEINLQKSYQFDRTLLFSTSSVEILTILLERGVPIDHKDENGCTALFYASGSDNKDEVKFLISQGADVNVQAGNFMAGETPLIRAVSAEDMEEVKMLVEAGANVNIGLTSGYRLTPLLMAAKHGDQEIVDYLIKNGADVNIKDNDGHTYLDLLQN